jgi:hypothetical protein
MSVLPRLLSVGFYISSSKTCTKKFAWFYLKLLIFAGSNPIVLHDLEAASAITKRFQKLPVAVRTGC